MSQLSRPPKSEALDQERNARKNKRPEGRARQDKNKTNYDQRVHAEAKHSHDHKPKDAKHIGMTLNAIDILFVLVFVLV